PATPTTGLLLGATYPPGRKASTQPSTRLVTAGLPYHMRPPPEAQVEANRRSGYEFPANILRVGYTSNLFSYGVNDFFSRTVPIFWGGNVDARHGIRLAYQRIVLHTATLFAFVLGGSASYCQRNGG